MVDMQSFCAICDGTGTAPEVANIACVTVINVKAGSKDTVLHVINELYTKINTSVHMVNLFWYWRVMPRPTISCRTSSQNMVQTSTGFFVILETGTCL